MEAERVEGGDPRSLILANGRIVTLDPARPEASAVGVREGRVIAVGSLKTVRNAVPGAKVHDLAGATVFPGLVDAHGHLRMMGERLRQLDLSVARSEAEVADLVRIRAAGVAPGKWIVGLGWDQNRFPGGRLPGKAVLDHAAPSNPVYLERIDGHAAWVNSRALEAAGIAGAVASPNGGRIVRDAAGMPTGVLVDAAFRPVSACIPQPSGRELDEGLVSACLRCASLGVTGVHDAGVDLETWRSLERLASEGRLPIRVYAMAWSGSPGLEQLLEPGPRAGLFGGMLSLRAVKFLLDGALGSSGAALFEDYADEPGERGLLLDPEGLARQAPALASRGFQLAVHAIGDRAAARALDILEEARRAVPGKDPRFRIEHAQLLRAMEVPRFAAAGIVASVQPSHLASDLPWVERRLGRARLPEAYPWRSLLDSGARLAFGSDFPIEPPDPRRGLHAALTRQDLGGRPEQGWFAEQRLTATQALAGYTSGAAWAAFEEKQAGRIREGYRADFSVFEENLLKLLPAELLTTRPIATLVRGQVVYSAPV